MLGLRFARPSSRAGWAAYAAYAGAIVTTLLVERRVLPGALEPGRLLRHGGTVLLVAGLLVAGSPLRARRREAPTGPSGRAGLPRAAAIGLGLVLLGTLARAPSLAGAAAAAIAITALAAAR